MAAPERIEDQWSNPRWRLNRLYTITDETGREIPFSFNPLQSELYDRLHHLNVVLKSRQLGVTTLIQLIMLDACLFNANVHAACIAHRQVDAIEIFDTVVKLAYDRLDPAIRAWQPAVQDSARKLSFANGSSIRTDTQIRGGTFQYLHISELGKLCAKSPEKAREVRTGALNTVHPGGHPGQMVIIESTAAGREGDFFDICERARSHRGPLTALDFRFHFFPWWRDRKCRLSEAAAVTIPTDLRQYFDALAAKGIRLTDGQKAWYLKKLATQRDDMKREFPSTPEEAFEAAVEGAYYGKALARLRAEGRITGVPWASGLEVNTFWDLGRDDQTAIWFHQRVGKEHRLIDYYASSGEGLAHYAQVLKEKPYVYGRHYLPHDVEVAELSTNRTRKATLEGLGVVPVEAVRRSESLADDIQATRNFLSSCWFDEASCDAAEAALSGIKALEGYRKAWDDKLGTFKDRPLHNWASHGADALRTGAIGFKEDVEIPAHVRRAFAERRRETRRGIL